MSRIPSLDRAFRERVYQIVRLIPYGRVATYGFVALLAGMPRHARQVGWALHTLPEALVWGLDTDVRHEVRRGEHGPGQPRSPQADAAREAALGHVPWHRVINAQGRVSTHPDQYGTLRQIELLREEGIDVANDGMLVKGSAAHQWHPDPAVVDGLELPAEVLYAIDRQLRD